MPRQNPVHYTGPEEASRAFYEAFEQGDVAAMMAVWSDDDEIYCIHPGGPRHVGPATVRGSWEAIFSGPTRIKFHLEQTLFFVGASIAVQSVFEYLQVDGDPKLRGPAVATNVFMRGTNGWRMLAHHASVSPTAQAAPAAAPRSGTLH